MGSELFLILAVFFFGHWLFDFVCQSDEQAVNKSHSEFFLMEHCMWYALGMTSWSLGLYFYFHTFAFWNCIEYLLFSGLYFFLTHLVIDYYTSKLNAKLWLAEKRHLFFTSVGFDQFIHCLLLFAFLRYVL